MHFIFYDIIPSGFCLFFFCFWGVLASSITAAVCLWWTNFWIIKSSSNFVDFIALLFAFGFFHSHFAHCSRAVNNISSFIRIFHLAPRTLLQSVDDGSLCIIHAQLTDRKFSGNLCFCHEVLRIELTTELGCSISKVWKPRGYIYLGENTWNQMQKNKSTYWSSFCIFNENLFISRTWYCSLLNRLVDP